MRKFLNSCLAGLLAFSFVSASFVTSAEARHGRKRAIAAGVIIGLSAAAIASSADASERRAWRRQCNRWDYRCDRGSMSACYKFENNC